MPYGFPDLVMPPQRPEFESYISNNHSPMEFVHKQCTLLHAWASRISDFITDRDSPEFRWVQVAGESVTWLSLLALPTLLLICLLSLFVLFTKSDRSRGHRDDRATRGKYLKNEIESTMYDKPRDGQVTVSKIFVHPIKVHRLSSLIICEA